MKILSNHELKDMGQPIKETDCWLFFEKGKIAKHTIEKFHKKMKLKDLELNYLLININQLTIQLTKKRDNMTQINEKMDQAIIDDDFNKIESIALNPKNALVRIHEFNMFTGQGRFVNKWVDVSNVFKDF